MCLKSIMWGKTVHVEYTYEIIKGRHRKTHWVQQAGDSRDWATFLVVKVLRTEFVMEAEPVVLAKTLDISVTLRRQNHFQAFILRNYTIKRAIGWIWEGSVWSVARKNRDSNISFWRWSLQYLLEVIATEESKVFSLLLRLLHSTDRNQGVESATIPWEEHGSRLGEEENEL